MYYNLIEQYGIEKFFRDFRKPGSTASWSRT